MKRVLFITAVLLMTCEKEEIKPKGTHPPLDTRQEQLVNKH